MPKVWGASRRAGALPLLLTSLLFLRPFGTPVRAAAVPDAPFVGVAGGGTAASARVDATVTRWIDGSRVTLPAARVPALVPGDIVDVSFPDYTRPPARVNYHVDVAFITEVAPQHWLFERSGPEDRLFPTPGKSRRRAPLPPPRGLHFTYGPLGRRGIPIFVIVPEDAKTRGMDGVRDYLNAHPTDFKDMAQSANEAVDRYVWFADFSNAVAQGSIDPVAAQQRVQSVAAALGANPAAVSACHAAGGSNAVIGDCINTAMQAVNYPTNIEAPTQAQFFGGVFGAVAPVAIASFLVPLLTIWKLFVRAGRQEYEYLPTTLYLPPGAGPAGELLTGLKVPTLRPPAAVSDALFFTIGDPQAVANPPLVVNAAPPNGVCAAGERVGLPLHLDRTSVYVHDVRAIVTPDGKPSYALDVDARSAAGPVVRTDQLRGAADGAYAVRLTGRYGFDALSEPAADAVRIALPHPGGWSLEAMPHRPAVAGGTFDAYASAAAASCLSRAELQIGDAPPVPLDLARLSDRRVSLHASLANVPPGDATVRLYQTDSVHDTEIESDLAVRIAPPPAHVDPKTPATANLGDAFLDLRGAAFETVSGVRLNGVTYAKVPGSTADDACFVGPPIGANRYLAGQSLSAELIESDGSPGQVFVVDLAPPRPAVLSARVSPDSAVHVSTQPLDVELTAAGALPSRYDVRVRRAPPPGTPCAAVGDAGAAVALPAAALTLRSAAALAVAFVPAAVLGDRAFGTLEIQLVDAATKSAGAWVALPGTFVRASQPAPSPSPAALPSPAASPSPAVRSAPLSRR